MKYNGRIFAIIIILFFHFLLIAYFYYNKGNIEPITLAIVPFMILVAYWAGKQFDKVKYYSDKDELTGLYNRRFVMNTFEKITSLAERTNSNIFLLVIDCDNFKDINDNHGHLKGDHILSVIGQELVDATRKSDLVARWGGDEFLIIGQLKEEHGLHPILKRIEERLEVLSNDVKIPIIVSIGSATFPDDSRDLFELIRIADKEMYNCKRTKK
jgi:diguanylate cyclase (GGDEF)-like protein